MYNWDLLRNYHTLLVSINSMPSGVYRVSIKSNPCDFCWYFTSACEFLPTMAGLNSMSIISTSVAVYDVPWSLWSGSCSGRYWQCLTDGVSQGCCAATAWRYWAVYWRSVVERQTSWWRTSSWRVPRWLRDGSHRWRHWSFHCHVTRSQSTHHHTQH